MNVRIHDKVVNIELNWKELTLLEREGWLTNMVEIGAEEHAALIYSLECTEEDDIEVCFALNRFRVLIPRAIVSKWILEERSFDKYDVPVDDRNRIRLHFEIEKRQEATLRVRKDRQAYLNFVN